jgi:hypothetical protein
MTRPDSANPANLINNDTVHDMFNKIVTTGNAANGVSRIQSEHFLLINSMLIDYSHSLPLPIR